MTGKVLPIFLNLWCVKGNKALFNIVIKRTALFPANLPILREGFINCSDSLKKEFCGISVREQMGQCNKGDIMTIHIPDQKIFEQVRVIIKIVCDKNLFPDNFLKITCMHIRPCQINELKINRTIPDNKLKKLALIKNEAGPCNFFLHDCHGNGLFPQFPV